MRQNGQHIAYFSSEIAFDPRVPNYAGGLGVLAGDVIRAAGDLNIPLIGVTLLYKKGFFFQELTTEGTQIEHPAHWAWNDFVKDTNTTVELQLAGRTIKVKAWEYQHKGFSATIPIICLDTDLPGNSDYDRQLTDYLYGKDNEYRMFQEFILGIGGVRILDALGHKIDKYHMNEGHSAFIALELYRQAKETHSDFDPDALLHFVVQDADLVLQVLLHHVELFLLDRLGSIVLLDALAGEDLHADDDALDARRADERRVAHVARLLAEDRPEQFFLGR